MLPALFVASNAFALGLGDIRLESYLNQPLRAEIELLSATPEELLKADEDDEATTETQAMVRTVHSSFETS